MKLIVDGIRDSIEFHTNNGTRPMASETYVKNVIHASLFKIVEEKELVSYHKICNIIGASWHHIALVAKNMDSRRSYKRQQTKALNVDRLVRVWWRLEWRYNQNSEAYPINYWEMVRFFHLSMLMMPERPLEDCANIRRSKRLLLMG